MKMTQTEMDAFLFRVRKRSDTLYFWQVADAVNAVLTEVSYQINLKKSEIRQPMKFASRWTENELEETDREVMEDLDITEEVYRAEMYAQCLLSTIAAQAKADDEK